VNTNRFPYRQLERGKKIVAIPQKGNCVLVEPDLISGKSRQHSRKL
jgi:hypothetical protein